MSIETGIPSILDERGARYGLWSDQAALSQQLKDVVATHLKYKGTALEPYQAEALEMILHKIARIVNGDPNYADSWIDIEGYARLVSRLLTR